MELPDRIAAGDLAGWMTERMEQRRMSQRALAMRSGVNHSTLSRLMAGDREPMLSTLLAVVRVLGSSEEGTEAA